MHVLMILCSDGWMSGNLSEGWRRLGWGVEEYFYGSHMGKDWTPEGLVQNEKVNRELFEKAQKLKSEGKLDLIFSVIYDDVLTVETAKKLKSLGAPMVNYHVDLVGQWQRVLLTGRYFDRVACAQKDHESALRRADIRTYYMPMAANPPSSGFQPPSPVGRRSTSDLGAGPLPSGEGARRAGEGKFDGILYLGSPWEFRTQALSALAKAGLPLKIYGNGWKTSSAQKFNFQPWQKTWHDLRYYALPFIREEGMRPLVKAVRRRLRHRRANVVPDHSIPPDCIAGSYRDSDFVPLVRGAAVNLGFTHFSGTPGTPDERRQVRLRDFEIPMAGGFYLAQDCAQLREFYQPGVHLALWNTVEELIDKAKYYVAHEEERSKIAAAGKAHAEAHHTWEKRFKGLLQELGMRS